MYTYVHVYVYIMFVFASRARARLCVRVCISAWHFSYMYICGIYLIICYHAVNT